MVERARLESEYTGNRIGGSNPPLSAKLQNCFVFDSIRSILSLSWPAIQYLNSYACSSPSGIRSDLMARMIKKFLWLCGNFQLRLSVDRENSQTYVSIGV